jgi:hypothetical protein
MNSNKMDVQKYKTFLKSQYLIPSRKILHENIDENFMIFENCGLKKLSDLKQAISTCDDPPNPFSTAENLFLPKFFDRFQ